MKRIIIIEDGKPMREITERVREEVIRMSCEPLTKRETEIANLIVEGKNSEEIAALLFISKFTVSNHRKNIKNKLHYNNLAQLPNKLGGVYLS